MIINKWGVNMKIKCDICNSPLEIDSDGKAHCRNCGMSYTIEALRQKYQGNNHEHEVVKKETINKNNYVRLKIKEIQTSLFSKDVTLVGNIIEGELKPREHLCLQGTKHPSYKVEWMHNISINTVRFRLEGMYKKMVNVGDVFETSYEKEEQFTNIIYKHFRSYEIDENITLGEDYYPITYLFRNQGNPTLAILLCNSRTYNSKTIQKTIEALEDNNIAVQRFYKDFRNDEQYVCKRIKSIL